MRYVTLAIAVLAAAAGAACSSDEREASFVPEAHAAMPGSDNDYGWRPKAPPAFAESEEVREYH